MAILGMGGQRVADTATMWAQQMAAPPEHEQRRIRNCHLAGKLCCVAVPLALITIACVLTMLEVQSQRYDRPEFNLTSLNASQPSVLLLGEKLVVPGWVACFSTSNPNPKPISYDHVIARLWAHRGRHDYPLYEADVAPFKQAAAGGEGRMVICVMFSGDAVMKIENDKTVWFDAVRLDANITYDDDRLPLKVVCEDVKVVVWARESAVTAGLDGGDKQCWVAKKAVCRTVWIFVIVAILDSFSLLTFIFCVYECFFR